MLTEEEKKIADDAAREGAAKLIEDWREAGAEYVSIVNNVPRPWERATALDVFASAQLLGVEALSLENVAHVLQIEEAIFQAVRGPNVADVILAFAPLPGKGGDA